MYILHVQHLPLIFIPSFSSILFSLPWRDWYFTVRHIESYAKMHPMESPTMHTCPLKPLPSSDFKKSKRDETYWNFEHLQRNKSKIKVKNSK